jgi:hypothetical protein
MQAPKIVTNKHPRELIALAELPEDCRNDFEYIENDEMHSPRLFKYRGEYYDLGDIMRVEPGIFPEFWHAVCGGSYFSGVLIHVCDTGEAVIVGSYYS